MASIVPKWVKKEIVDRWISSVEDGYLMLLKNTYVPSAAHQYVWDVNPPTNEITDIGSVYPAGGVPILLRTSQPSGNNYYLDAADTVIGPGAYLNFRYGIYYTKTGGSGQATYKIRAIIDFDPVTELDQVVTNGTITVGWNALGILLVS
jgi:hypothetical protein